MISAVLLSVLLAFEPSALLEDFEKAKNIKEAEKRLRHTLVFSLSPFFPDPLFLALIWVLFKLSLEFPEGLDPNPPASQPHSPSWSMRVRRDESVVIVIKHDTQIEQAFIIHFEWVNGFVEMKPEALKKHEFDKHISRRLKWKWEASYFFARLLLLGSVALLVQTVRAAI